jgi:hypothetical protein
MLNRSTVFLLDTGSAHGYISSSSLIIQYALRASFWERRNEWRALDSRATDFLLEPKTTLGP